MRHTRRQIFTLRIDHLRRSSGSPRSDRAATVLFTVIVTSIVFLPVWKKIESYLLIDIYDRDGGHVDPRIRIGFVGMPEQLGRDVAFATMPCVACGRPNHPLRRREGDDWSRLYYAPTCALAVRVACSRSRSAELEYERFKSLPSAPSAQLTLAI